jgi:hypothetical protein
MSSGPVCVCSGPDSRRHWRVVQRRQNCSAFNGYHPTPSVYSEVRCLACGSRWRTRAKYVHHLPDEERSIV